MAKGYFKTDEGAVFTVPEEQVKGTLESGFQPATVEEADAYDRITAGQTNEVMTAESALPPDAVEGIAAKTFSGVDPEVQPLDAEQRSREEFSGPIQTTMAGLEGLADGLLFNIPGAVLSSIDPEYAKRRKLREEANPNVSNLAEWAGILGPAVGTAGTSLIPKALAKTPRIYAALKAASELDIAGKLVGSATKAITTGKRASEVDRLLRPLAESNLDNLAATAGARGEAYAAPTAAAIDLEVARLAEQVVQDRLLGVGAKPEVVAKVKRFVRNNVIATGGVQAVAGALQGGIAGAGAGVKDAAAAGEDLAPAFWEGLKGGGETGGLVGTALGFGVPAAGKSLALTSKVINAGLQKLSRTLLPKFSPRFSGASEESISRSMAAAKEARGAVPIEPVVDDIADALDNEFGVGIRLRNEVGTGMKVADQYLRSGDIIPAERNFYKNVIRERGGELMGNLETASSIMRGAWQKKLPDGKYVFDRKKLLEYFKNYRLDPATGKVPEAGVQLPEEIVEYNTALNAFIGFLDEQERSLRSLIDPDSLTLVERFEEDLVTGVRELGIGKRTAQSAAQKTATYAELKDTFRAVKDQQRLSGRSTATATTAVGVISLLQNLDNPLVGGAYLAGASGFGKIIDALYDPAAAIETLAKIDTAAMKSGEATKKFTTSLVSKRAPRSAARGIERSVVQITTPNTPISNIRDIYLQEKEQVERLQDPTVMEGVFTKTYGGLDEFSPEIDGVVKNTVIAGASFLNDKLPRQPASYRMSTPWTPNLKEMNKYLRYAGYTRNPDSFYTDVERLGYVPDEGLEVMTTLYPKRLAGLRVQLLDKLTTSMQKGEAIDPQSRGIINKILGTQTDGLDTGQIKRIQDAMLPPNAESPRRTPKDSEREKTETENTVSP